MSLIQFEKAITLPDGVETSLQIVQPETESMIDSVLVWLPAMGVAAKHYRLFAKEWALKGHAVVLLECRGNGASSVRARRGLDFGFKTVLEQDLPAQIEIIKALYPDYPIVIGGHSLGGQLATLFSGYYADRLDRLILVGSGTPWYVNYGRFKRYGLWLILLGIQLITWFYGYFPGRKVGFGGNESKSCVRDWAYCGFHGRYEILDSDFDWEQAMSVSTLPVYSVHYEHDKLITYNSWQHLLSKVKNGRQSTKILTNEDLLNVPADHFSWMQSPKSTVEALRELGAGQSSRP